MFRVCLAPLRHVPLRRHFSSHQFDTKLSLLSFPEQKVFCGTKALDGLIAHLSALNFKRPIIVTDKGLQKIGLADKVNETLQKSGWDPLIYDGVHPNPLISDSKEIAEVFLENNCDFVVGVGGGGPLDAMKGGMAVVAKQRSDDKFSVSKDSLQFLNNIRSFLPKISDSYRSQVPFMVAIPTTAGTGSEGGKSAVLTGTDGSKFVFGNPIFFPKLVALSPQLTMDMPPQLTAATGIDALFHLLEAYFVTHKAGIADGLDDIGIARCEEFALQGAKLIAEHLPTACSNGKNIESRFYMQIAALYGAKAFRKGDLGGVHATGHSIGAKYHLHHGAAIARMSVPVLRWNIEHADGELKEKLKTVEPIFSKFGGKDLAGSIEKLLIELKLERGLSGLNVSQEDLKILSSMANADGCQTNPIPLSQEDYYQIFLEANKIK